MVVDFVEAFGIIVIIIMCVCVCVCVRVCICVNIATDARRTKVKVPLVCIISGAAWDAPAKRRPRRRAPSLHVPRYDQTVRMKPEATEIFASRDDFLDCQLPIAAACAQPVAPRQLRIISNWRWRMAGRRRNACLKQCRTGPTASSFSIVPLVPLASYVPSSRNRIR